MFSSEDKVEQLAEVARIHLIRLYDKQGNLGRLPYFLSSHLSGHPPQTGAEFFFFAVLGMTGNAERAASLSIA